MMGLGDPGQRRRRLDARYREPVTGLNRLIDQIRTELGRDDIPYFDPAGGGSAAKGLLLLRDPSRTALQTGFISPDNPDATARSTSVLRDLADIDRKLVVHWNAIPWHQGDRRMTAAERDQCAVLLARVLDKLPDVHGVVLMGDDAQRVWGKTRCSRTFAEFPCPHPSRRGLARRAGEQPGDRADLVHQALVGLRDCITGR